MSGYSVDLRERVIKAWQDGKTQAWVAETFAVSAGSIKRYIRRFQQTGSVAPIIQGRAQPLIKLEQAEAVQALVDRLPEATLEDYCAAWEQETGQRVSVPTMCRALQRFDRPRKKRQSGPPNAMRRPVKRGAR